MSEHPEHVCRGCGSLVFIDDTRCIECHMIRPPRGWRHITETGDAFLGKVIGERYLLSRHLGTGASGSVYRAESLIIPRRFAVKLIHLNEKQSRARFEREVNALARLRNPHVVSFYEIIDINTNLIAVVMDLVEGVTLQQYVTTRGPISHPEVIHLARQLANGLFEAHELGLIHRDIKPENLMLERLPAGGSFLRVLDFGIVWMKGSVHLTQGFVGTPLFCSPEQAIGGEIEEQSDIYSMGAVLFYMLTGRPPFESTSTMRVLHDHVTKAPPSLFDTDHGRHAPDELEALVNAMLAKDPLERPPTMAHVIEALDTVPSRTTVAETLSPLESSCDECGIAAMVKSLGRPESDVACMASVPIEAATTNGHFVASATQSRLAVVDSNNILRWFSLTLRKEQGERLVLDSPVQDIAMSSDRVWLGLASGELVAVDDRGIETIHQFGAPVSHLAIDYREQHVVVALEDGRVLIRNPDRTWASFGLDHVDAIAITRSGDECAVAQGSHVTIRPTHDFGKPVTTVEERQDVTSLAFSHDGYLLAMATATGRVHLENPDTGAEVVDLGDLGHKVRQVGFSPANILMALCTDDTRAYILDLQCQHAPECSIEQLRCHRFAHSNPTNP